MGAQEPRNLGSEATAGREAIYTPKQTEHWGRLAYYGSRSCLEKTRNEMTRNEEAGSRSTGASLCVYLRSYMEKILQRKDWGHKFARDYEIKEASILGTGQEAPVVHHLPDSRGKEGSYSKDSWLS